MKKTARTLGAIAFLAAIPFLGALAAPCQTPPAKPQAPPAGAPGPQGQPLPLPKLAPVPPPPAAPASGPRTTAEATDYAATSTCADVTAFIRDLQKLSPLVRVETIATSTEGRDIPLLVVGQPVPRDPLALRYDKRVVVYIQANIHAGEVEGKESALMLVRDIVLDPKRPYLDRLVLVVAPIFNADGNDKMDPRNRYGQVGPEKGSGVRHNGQNLDLNRDAMKLESPELRGLVRNVLGCWDPLLFVDCHTTDGSFHQEPVTYSWPLCPNGDAVILKYARDKMLPAVDAVLEKKYGTLGLPYGDPMDFRDMGKGWRTFGHEPRYMTNYIGLRNRLAVLIENYNYADFRTRVAGNYHMLQALLDYCWTNAAELQTLVADADARTVQAGLAPAGADTFGLDIDVRPLPAPISVLGYEMEAPPASAEGAARGPFPRLRPTNRSKTYTMPYHADFFAKRTVRLPFAYLIAAAGQDIPAKLRQHGVVVERLTEPAVIEAEAFRIQEVKGAERLYQGHRTNTVKGQYALEKKDFPAGTLLVRTAQPLGRLAAYLLEAESDDGLLVWNFFDRDIVAQWGRAAQTYPVYKIYGPANLAAEAID
ncbi:MAG TPA: M14 family metallopeptidase [Candidatus Aminicenantes bacterium]|nr:M14 family metallopeptidase [Candidatus Aminicenantes bacterium]HRY64619.1 M14 family metallopeptidase [Candidatus Aminicenantes bacterium]HRZ71532.1 M14 family metallopeptidase [Candidatus Aminicenantes bacterium]